MTPPRRSASPTGCAPGRCSGGGDGRRGGGREAREAARKTLERLSGEFGVRMEVHDTLDAAQSYAHEVIAHKGMEEMLGKERYAKLCERLGSALGGKRLELVRKYEGSDARTLGDEYIAAIAEQVMDADGNVREPSLWEKIKAAVRGFFREAFNLELTDADIKYMLWKSAERLRRESRSAFQTAEDVVTEQKLKVEAARMRRAQADYLREMKDITERAKADGTYMKAPNGKPSNLNTRQWAQVRTARFKNWFGDWEKPLRIEKLRKSKPVTISGNEIGPGDDLKQYMANAREHGKALRGSYTNKDTGRSFTLGKQGVLEVLNHDSLDAVQLQSVAAIPQIIENSIYIDSLPNEDASKNPDVRQYHYFVCGLKVGNADYTVRAVIAERANGEWYYDHKLTQIEKGKLLDSLSGITTPGFSQEASKDSAGKDRRLSSILQANCSKIVDENGEPKVVYHQTDSRFNSFDIDKARTSADIQAFFFAPEYDKYHGYGEHTVEAFINLRNPAEDPSGPDMSVEDGGVRAREELERSGHDGFMRTEEGVEEYAVFSPSQIKSATDNIGTFDEGDSDIRFRLGEKRNGGDDTLYRSDDTMYRIREEAPPERTGTGYKVFVLRDGELYPPMVANPGGGATPLGVWLDADAAPIAGRTKTGRAQVKAGGKGTQGGGGRLAYRPGWHLGGMPYATQFNRRDESGNKTLFPSDFVWAEVEYADDADYQEEAMSYGYTEGDRRLGSTW